MAFWDTNEFVLSTQSVLIETLSSFLNFNCMHCTLYFLSTFCWHFREGLVSLVFLAIGVQSLFHFENSSASFHGCKFFFHCQIHTDYSHLYF